MIRWFWRQFWIAFWDVTIAYAEALQKKQVEEAMKRCGVPFSKQAGRES
jgi:hypothetical protein